MRRYLLFMAVLCLTRDAPHRRNDALRGRSLAEALHILEGRGLQLIYSNDVVRPEMIVGIEPKSTEPRQMLDELLREHHLHATNGPRGSIVIVRDAEKAAPRAAKTKPAQMPVALESIVVTPSRFTIFTSEPEGHQFLSRDEVRTVPHLGDDVYRAFDRLPGITGLDLSARFNIRGGQEDETQVLMDGAEIYDPFHVRDLYRAFSTIDAEAIGAVDVLTGGFPLQYGGRMSGVIDISSLKPEARRHTELGHRHSQPAHPHERDVSRRQLRVSAVVSPRLSARAAEADRQQQRRDQSELLRPPRQGGDDAERPHGRLRRRLRLRRRAENPRGRRPGAWKLQRPLRVGESAQRALAEAVRADGWLRSAVSPRIVPATTARSTRTTKAWSMMTMPSISSRCGTIRRGMCRTGTCSRPACR